MRILLELDAEVARAMLAASTASAMPPRAAALLSLAVHLGLQLQPLHPGVADPQLANWFGAELVDEGATRTTLEQLRGSEAVTAAYAKPSDAAPR